ncbi:hypothetical protein [Owenweeksia hongkongensis]|uniref:hypothetical protein n=1 Tax=Owenweeksia hongkongensis TaxID=253245 RepID=UPI003A9227DA
MTYFSKIFWVSLFTFVLNQIIEVSGIFIPYVHSYLDDVLCSPIVLGFGLFVQQQFTYRNLQYTLTIPMIILFVAWYALIFEVFLPYSSSSFHADWLDVLAYAFGALLFWRFGNNPASKFLFSKNRSLVE